MKRLYKLLGILFFCVLTGLINLVGAFKIERLFLNVCFSTQSTLRYLSETMLTLLTFDAYPAKWRGISPGT